MADLYQDEQALIAVLQQHVRIESQPEALEIWLLSPAAIKQTATLMASLGAMVAGFIAALAVVARPGGSWVVLGSAVSVALVLGLIGMIVLRGRQVATTPTVRVTGATLETMGRTIPLESIQNVTAATSDIGHQLELDLDTERLRIPYNKPGIGDPLVRLLRAHIARRSDALAAEGHDVSQPARVPPEVRRLRER